VSGNNRTDIALVLFIKHKSDMKGARKMAALLKFFSQNLAIIVTLVVGFVPLFIAVLKLLGNRAEKVKASLDSSVIVRKIKRQPIEKGLWEDLSGKERRNVSVTILINAGYLLLLILCFELDVDFKFILLIFILYLPILISSSRFLINYFTGSYKYWCEDANEARFYLFQEMHMSVEGEAKIIFLKAQRALLGKHVQHIEVDYDNDTGEIEAFYEGGSLTTRGIISVVVKPDDDDQVTQKIQKKTELTNQKEGEQQTSAQQAQLCITIDFRRSPSALNRFVPHKLPKWLSDLLIGIYSFVGQLYSFFIKPPSEDVIRAEERSQVINRFIEKFLTTKAS